MDPNLSTDIEFDLDVSVITDLVPEANTGCATEDGCAPTCASSCTSKV